MDPSHVFSLLLSLYFEENRRANVHTERKFLKKQNVETCVYKTKCSFLNAMYE